MDTVLIAVEDLEAVKRLLIALGLRPEGNSRGLGI